MRGNISTKEETNMLFKKAKEKYYWVEWHFLGENSYQVDHATSGGLASMEADPMVEIIRVSRA